MLLSMTLSAVVVVLPLARLTPKHVMVQAVLMLSMGMVPTISVPHTDNFECVGALHALQTAALG